jgi:small-conductance mechanosensitive channel
VRRFWSPFTRNLLIVAAIAIVVVVLSLEETLDVVGGLLSIAFFLAVAFFLFLLWRERRGDIEAWSDWNLLVFFVVLAVCALTIVRVWRAEHRYV